MKTHTQVLYKVAFCLAVGALMLPMQSQAATPDDAVMEPPMEAENVEHEALMEDESKADDDAEEAATDEEMVPEEEAIADEECSDKYFCSGELILRYGDYRVSGDRGRFREDNWIKDNGRGGIEWMQLDCTPPDDCGWSLHFHGKAIYDDWYDAYLFAQRGDSDLFVKSAYTEWRHYFDGTTRFAKSQEINDRDLYLERRTYLAELGYAPECRPNLLFGWHRLENDGDSTTLRGVSKQFGGPYNLVGPLHQDGTTDNIYAQFSHTFRCKYNFNMRTEYEQYTDHQHGKFQDEAKFKDDNYYRIWRQYVMFDTFCDCNTYASLNYMYVDVVNTSTRDVLGEYIGLDTDNRKYAHIGMGRFNKERFLGVCFLNLDARLRAEYNDTSLDSSELNFNSRHGGLWDTYGTFQQRRFEESLRLTYKGLYRTTLTADVFFEQRNENRDWFVDRFEDCILTEDLDRKTDIHYYKQQYTLTGVHRFSNCLKGTLRGRYQRRVRDYHEKVDVLLEREDGGFVPVEGEDYPGYLGDLINNQGQVTAKLDWQLNPCLNVFSYYQWVEESKKTDLGGRVGRFTAHRVATTFSWDVSQCLYLSATGIYENYRLDTPTDIQKPPLRANTTWEPGSQYYDYKGDNFTITTNGIWGINPETKFMFGYRHTEALGRSDFAGNYSLDKIDLGIWRDICGLGEVTLDYHYIHFNDQRKEDDDYDAHGWVVTWKHLF